MPRIRWTAFAFAVLGLSLGTLVGAQVVSGVSGGVPGGIPGQVPPRDPALAQQPTERRIPVGTSQIRGMVVTADTGRPIAGARVAINGQVTANIAATQAAVAAAQAAPQSGRVAVAGGPPSGAGGARGGGAGLQVIASASSLNRSTVTDASGQFSFPRLPAGQFMISVTQNQYLYVNYGQTRPGGQGKFVPLADGQQLTISVALPRGGVITGMVIGPDGEPQRGAQIRGWRHDMSSGFKRLQGTGFATSDDRGIYRMAGLQPGEYFISATPSATDLITAQMNPQADIERAILSAPIIPPAATGMTPTVSVPVPTPQPGGSGYSPGAYLPTYAPSAMAASGATAVTVGANEERNGVDVRVQLVQATNIQGTVSTPLEGVQLQMALVSDDQGIDSPQPNQARPDNNGLFTFRGVPPGNYTVFAQTMPPQPTVTIINGQQQPQTQPPPVLTDAQKMWGKTRVTVTGEPLVTMSVSLKPSRSISGVVAFAMARPPDLTRTRFTVTLSPAPSPQPLYFGSQPQAQVEPDGRFTITGVMPGRYILRASGTMKSAVVGGQDTLDFPLEFTGDRDVTDAVLTVTDQVSELSGTLMDSAGKPSTDYTIIVATTDSRYWTPSSRRIVMTRPGPDGKYTVRNLPPGNYQLAAVFDLEQGAQYDPEFLRSLSRAAVPVTIVEGGKATQDLRVK